MTISYGHGISTTPMHLAAGYAALANGGRLVQPTILKQNGPQMGERIVSEDVARASLDMLRGVVSSGTASMADSSIGRVTHYILANPPASLKRRMGNC